MKEKIAKDLLKIKRGIPAAGRALYLGQRHQEPHLL